MTEEITPFGGHRPPLQSAVPIQIKLRAMAIEGKANAALLNFLAEQLEIAEHAIVLKRGEKSREKLIRIEGLREIEIHRRLGIRQPAGPGC